VNLFDAIDGLRATRVYDGRAVPRATLDRILEAATRACSSGNTQPWEFVVVTDGDTKTRLQALLSDAWIAVDARKSSSSTARAGL
jgi:nitroreductase